MRWKSMICSDGDETCLSKCDGGCKESKKLEIKSLFTLNVRFNIPVSFC